MDYFIELVEKIERHPSVGGRRNIRDVANFIRKLEFDDDMWTLLLGKSFQELPHNVLARDELQSLREMMPHRFENFQERGVLLSDQGNTVAIGRVILGICAGLARDETLVIDAAKAESERVVDNLFAATVARDIVHGALLAEGGLCASPFGSTLGFWAPTEHCPAQYVLNTDGCRVSVAVLLGDIDGFLLGTQVILTGQGVSLVTCGRAEILTSRAVFGEVASASNVAELVHFHIFSSRFPNGQSEELVLGSC